MKPLKKLIQLKRSKAFKLILLLLLFCPSTRALDISKLIFELNKLGYDSVKVYSFNCTSSVKIEDYGLIADTSLVNQNRQWAYTVAEYGTVAASHDIKNLFGILFKNERSKTTGDPVGCYLPRFGYVFFEKGIPVAHIDICLECDKAVLEIFRINANSFRYYFKTLSHAAETKLSAACKRFKLPCCGS